MKNSKNFGRELLFTLLVAVLLSTVLAVILAFVLANLHVADAMTYVSAVSGMGFGLIIGYRLNSLMRLQK